ncbi:hypothetical protein [Rubritalea tangerina]
MMPTFMLVSVKLDSPAVKLYIESDGGKWMWVVRDKKSVPE